MFTYSQQEFFSVRIIRFRPLWDSVTGGFGVREWGDGCQLPTHQSLPSLCRGAGDQRRCSPVHGCSDAAAMPSEALAPAPSSTTLKRRLDEETACSRFGKLSGAALLSSGQSRACEDAHASGSHQVPSAPPPPAAEMGHIAVTALSRSIFFNLGRRWQFRCQSARFSPCWQRCIKGVVKERVCFSFIFPDAAVGLQNW